MPCFQFAPFLTQFALPASFLSSLCSYNTSFHKSQTLLGPTTTDRSVVVPTNSLLSIYHVATPPRNARRNSFVRSLPPHLTPAHTPQRTPTFLTSYTFYPFPADHCMLLLNRILPSHLPSAYKILSVHTFSSQLDSLLSNIATFFVYLTSNCCLFKHIHVRFRFQHV